MLPPETAKVHASSDHVMGEARPRPTSPAIAPARRLSGERMRSIATYRETTVISGVRSSTLYVPRGEFLAFSPPVIGEEEIEAVVDTLRSDWLTTGPKTRRFEQEFAKYVGASGALALNSCTAGLHTALAALGIGPGDEVITTPMTFAATANVIEHVGARPVFVDVEPDTLNIDPAKIEQAITARTKAIIAVHYSGHPADLDAIEAVARENDLFVIEDAAHCTAGVVQGSHDRRGTQPDIVQLLRDEEPHHGRGRNAHGQ